MSHNTQPTHGSLHDRLHPKSNEIAHDVRRQITTRYIKYKSMADYLMEIEKICRDRMARDFMYVLFYESNRGHLMTYFQYIKVFIFDTYLWPKAHAQSRHSKASREYTFDDGEDHDSSSNADETMEDAEESEDEDTNDDDDDWVCGEPRSEFEAILLGMRQDGVDERSRKRRAGKYIERNESYIRLLLNTMEAIEERVEFDEYINYVSNVNNAKFSNIVKDDNDLIPEEKEIFELMDGMSDRERDLLDKKVMSNMNIAKYLTSCNWCYFHLRYLILVCIAVDSNIAAYLGRMSDPKKYKNFPLYVNILLKDVENKPFNNITSSGIISEFLQDCMNFYDSGIVKTVHAEKFYHHKTFKI